ncbi:MAG TPA: hypothetical protein ENH49_05430 [Candidatus Marinimicrobia bacterium]|nr:hypothetical protein [Candidatus Neomarinimicrobiota bacterium]
MALTEDVIKKIADDTDISIDELTASGILAFLREKRRKIMLDKLEVLSRHNVTSSGELEKKIKSGEVAEHMTWEDLILLENLETAITLIDEDIKLIQQAA